MVDVYRAEAVKKTEHRELPLLPITSCPACESTDTLRVARGMILCTNCFWAIELKQAS